ncbi:MAG: carboxypeptidase regulatory-like domain-containing protein, partial [Clostridia bacterium]|nr:carboxypeptidase regulatory-like domain-containing protein [Clostridia bacterium]
IIKASLVDSAGEEMCDRFTDLQNTTAYKNFEKQTIHDFEDRYVVNFDDSEDNNFGVLNENVVVVEPGRGENIFTYINNLDDSGEESDNVEEYYEFENPGDEISDLEPGDYVYIEDTTHLIKVENVLELDSNTVRLTPDKDMELYEAYDVVKVDTVVYAESAELQGAGVSLAASDEDVSVGGEFNAELGGSFEKELTEWLKLEGSLTGSFSAEIKIAYDIRWFAKDEFTFSLITGTNIKASITLSVFTNNDDLLEDAQEEKALTEIKLGKLKIPTNIPGLTITTTPFIPLEAELSAGITVEYTNKSRSGFIFSNINGKQKIDKKEETTKFYGEGKFTVKAGPKVEVGVEFLEEVLEAKLTIFGGLQVEATLVLRSDYLEETTTDDMHACNACLDCDVSWFFEANASLTYNLKPGKKNKKDDKNKLSGKLINIDIVKASGHFPISPKCYISLLNDAASVFEGEITFGWGECPNKKYRTEFVVKDEDGNEIPNVETVITNYAGENYGGGNTKFAEYLYKGEYIALCSVEGVSYHEIFEVEDSAQTVTILTVTKGTLEGKICDAEDRVTVLPGALIEIYKDGELYTTKTADSNGAYSVELHVGEYTIKISHDGYIDFKCHATVEPDRTTYMETFLMIEGEEGDEGAASGKVMNSLTGEGEDGVTLEFLPDWNNKSETAEAVASTTSDSDGDYEIELPIGNYTVRASKEEFTTSYFNIIVIPDETTDNQNGVITPVLGEGEGDNYLITLSWGANPRDLDSHLVGPLTNGGTFHVFYSDKSKYDGDIEVCNLDYDDTSSYGPEHITLVTLTDGAYYFYVHKYAGTGEIPTSEARVTIERGNTLVAVYNVPTSLAAARYWNVFAIKDGQIIVSNTITESPDTSYAG